MLEEGKDIEDIVRNVLKGFDVEVLYKHYPECKCKCSQERVEKTLISLGNDELKKMAEEMLKWK